MNTQFIFFSGKGGVGKTSIACATAVYHADQGRRTLIAPSIGVGAVGFSNN